MPVVTATLLHLQEKLEQLCEQQEKSQTAILRLQQSLEDATKSQAVLQQQREMLEKEIKEISTQPVSFLDVIPPEPKSSIVLWLTEMPATIECGCMSITRWKDTPRLCGNNIGGFCDTCGRSYCDHHKGRFIANTPVCSKGLQCCSTCSEYNDDILAEMYQLLYELNR